MVQRYGSLNERQLEVLKWIHDGCPDGVWTAFTYKRTTYTPADRKLVTVDKRRGSWSASITDDGRYYHEHGTHKVEQAPAAPVTSAGMYRAVARSNASSDSTVVSACDLTLLCGFFDGGIAGSSLFLGAFWSAGSGF